MLYILVSRRCSGGGPSVARRAFGTDQAFADAPATLAANLGLHNGIVVAGLIWGAVASDSIGFKRAVFFLRAVAIAGIYGVAAVEFGESSYVQTVSARLALAAVLLAG